MAAQERRSPAAEDVAESLRGATASDQESVLRLKQILDRFLALPDQQRAALHLVAVEGLSYQEAAAALGVPIGTLMSRLSRARATIRCFDEGTGSIVRPPATASRRFCGSWEAPMSEVVSDADLDAYIDDELDMMRRLRSRIIWRPIRVWRPRLWPTCDARCAAALAARADADRRSSDDRGRKRLKHRFVWRCIADKLRGVAAVGFFVSFGWYAHGEAGLMHLGGPGSIGRGAGLCWRCHHRASRRGDDRQIDTHCTSDCPAEIEARMNIRIPPLPTDWTVNDVQIFRGHEGSSIEESIPRLLSGGFRCSLRIWIATGCSRRLRRAMAPKRRSTGNPDIKP